MSGNLMFSRKHFPPEFNRKVLSIPNGEQYNLISIFYLFYGQ